MMEEIQKFIEFESSDENTRNILVIAAANYGGNRLLESLSRLGGHKLEDEVICIGDINTFSEIHTYENDSI